MAISRFFFLIIVAVARCRQQTVQPCDNPVYCYGDLLNDVQVTFELFQDSKTFVDMPMKESTGNILAAYNNLTNISLQILQDFVTKWFDPPGYDLLPWEPPDWTVSPPFIASIVDQDFQLWALELNTLWKSFGKQLKQSVGQFPSRHSLLPVTNPFIAAGGRFIEYYYWDSYWIIRGLLLCGMYNTTQGMIRNLASLINQYGFVPNGGRVYYTRRSQPPLLTWMVSSYYNFTNDSSFVRELLPTLDIEYQFWMTNRTMFVSQCNCTVNLYSCPVTAPRPESYKEDLRTAGEVTEESHAQLYSNLASAAESGWDFSSRWLSPTGPLVGQLASVRTKTIVPVDLNAILGANEILLYRLHLINGSTTSAADRYKSAWNERKVILNTLLWSEEDSLYKDWSLEDNTHVSGFYASSVTPFYTFSLTDDGLNITRNRLALNRLRSLGVLGYPGGLPTSLNSSEQQWDFPNAWAPMQWFLVKGWERAEDLELRGAASDIAFSWLRSTHQAWLKYNHTMFEKYNCTVLGEPGGGGEYTIQSGFGWSNGVVLDFLSSYPSATAFVSSSSHSPSLYLWFLFLVPVLLVTVVTLLCVFCCHHVYWKGKTEYWLRIRNEQLLNSNNGSQNDPQSPTVYSNEDAINSSVNGSPERTVYHLTDV